MMLKEAGRNAHVDNSLGLPKIRGLCDLLERCDIRDRSLASCLSGETRSIPLWGSV